MPGTLTLPEWLPSGPFHVGSFGVSAAGVMGTTPPFGKSVDMVDVCTQLMEAGGGAKEGGGFG